jgi:hypothetical protein
MVVLRTTAPLRGEELKTIGDFVVSEGQMVSFVLTYSASHLPPPAPVDARAALADTEAYWHEWSSRCVDVGEWTPAVRRSLITLKALTYRPTGGIVAAPTTSLPEQLGGSRNWDYPLLLAARRHLDAACADERRLLRGRASVDRVAAAGYRPAARLRCRSCMASPASGG